MIYFRTLIFSLIILAYAMPASAQLLVIGEGAAASCYNYAKSGDMGSRSARHSCKDALKEDLSVKNRAATNVNYGILLMRKKNYVEAISSYQSALDLKLDLTEAYVNLAAAQIFTNDLEAVSYTHLTLPTILLV